MRKDILERSFNLGVDIIKFARKLPKETVSYVLGRQIVRSATSIAANIEEAQAGVSRADFANKMGIALKEGRETHLWLRFIEKSGLSDPKTVIPLLDETEQLRKILTTISKKVNPYQKLN